MTTINPRSTLLIANLKKTIKTVTDGDVAVGDIIYYSVDAHTKDQDRKPGKQLLLKKSKHFFSIHRTLVAQQEKDQERGARILTMLRNIGEK